MEHMRAECDVLHQNIQDFKLFWAAASAVGSEK
jgi:hypothetical protein